MSVICKKDHCLTGAQMEHRARMQDHFELEMVGAPPCSFYQFICNEKPRQEDISLAARQIEDLSGPEMHWLSKLQQGVFGSSLVLGVIGVVCFCLGSNPFGLMVAGVGLLVASIAIALVTTRYEMAEGQHIGENISFKKVCSTFFKYFGTPELAVQQRGDRLERVKNSLAGLYACCDQERWDRYLEQDREFFEKKGPKIIKKLEQGESIFAEEIQEVEKELAATQGFWRNWLGPRAQQFCSGVSNYAQWGGVLGSLYFPINIISSICLSAYIGISSVLSGWDLHSYKKLSSEQSTMLTQTIISPETYVALHERKVQVLQDRLSRLQAFEEVLFPKEEVSEIELARIQERRDALRHYLTDAVRIKESRNIPMPCFTDLQGYLPEQAKSG